MAENADVCSRENTTEKTKCKEPIEKVTYSNNLKLDVLLGLQTNRSGQHEEEFFHTFHQVCELWFRQIIFELDSIRHFMLNEQPETLPIMVVIERFDRILKIIQVLIDQTKVLETMQPLQFSNFRPVLGQSSGFESFQFRIIENKLGVKKGNRILHNGCCYSYVFDDDEKNLEKIKLSESEESLFDCVNLWLERIFTSSQEKVEDFMTRFSKAYKEAEGDNTKSQETIDQISENSYETLRAKGDRRLSWKAFVTALMIQYEGRCGEYKNEWQLLNLIMDVDTAFMKWRYTHLTVVYRQIGVRQGTGNSSGYYYLRSTISERYHVFKDLFRLSSFLIPEMFLGKQPY